MMHDALNRLDDALRSFDCSGAAAAAAGIAAALYAGETLEREEAGSVLNRLRKGRRFREMQQVADALISRGIDNAEILRQYAQAMIELGELAPAQVWLERLLGSEPQTSREWPEIKGLLGRVHKQRFVCGDSGSLASAVGHYLEPYDLDPVANTWHGINVVALLARAERGGIPVPGAPPFRSMAAHILRVLGTGVWDLATAVEAHVALGDWAAARQKAERYARAESLGAFHLASTIRQFREIWQLDSATEPGSELLPILESELLARSGGALELSAGDVRNGLERNFGGEFNTYRWYKTGLDRCHAIARIETRMEEAVGTGFVLDGGGLAENLRGQPVLLTNAHVVSEGGRVRKSIAPENAVAFFEVRGERLKCGRVLASSPPGHLDFSVVTLTDGAAAPCCPADSSARPFQAGGRLYVVGHPGGGTLSFSLQDSVWLDADELYLHYRTPTEQGSSGSPVFDQTNWEVIGLHHSGKEHMRLLNGKPGSYEANEGIRLSAIRDAIVQSQAAAV